MTTAWVIMTAMPPTKGHANLIKFAASLGTPRVKVIVCTQPHEPRPYQRYAAVAQMCHGLMTANIVQPIWLNEEVEQDPSAPGFWEFWDKTILGFGWQPGDIWVTSEPYGATLAERLDGLFMPYDPQRELTPVKATRVREDPLKHFGDIMPEFQPYIRKTVTFFGAESTGKTTVSREVAKSELIDGEWLFEWARPYLETVGKEITVKAMTDIWHGQSAAQRSVPLYTDKPFIVQDTDLYSTIGYWEQPHWTEALGPVPEGLILDAKELQSDLYIIPMSNIPFEQDDIRYGVDKRESPDEFWIGIAEKYGLNYITLDKPEFYWRYAKSVHAMRKLFYESHGLTYDRKGM